MLVRHRLLEGEFFEQKVHVDMEFIERIHVDMI